jgi:hypothetical protein
LSPAGLDQSQISCIAELQSQTMLSTEGGPSICPFHLAMRGALPPVADERNLLR